MNTEGLVIKDLQHKWDLMIAERYEYGKVLDAWNAFCKQFDHEVFRGNNLEITEKLFKLGMCRLPLISRKTQVVAAWYRIYKGIPLTAWLVRAIPGSLEELISLPPVLRYEWLHDKDVKRLVQNKKGKTGGERHSKAYFRHGTYKDRKLWLENCFITTS
ncbi:hypothetical protein IIB51_02360 [Patescibacteria group bacterium]|nr:hypothetical protein [Patescibacteria group bacterium]